MATLTEKDWEVQVNEQLLISFYAELRNGIVNDVFVTINLDGFHVTWATAHQHSLIRVYEIGKLTNDWLRVGNLLGKDQFKAVEDSLKSFLNENLTFNN